MKSRRKSSGGILHTVKATDKKLCWRGGEFAATTISHSDEDVEIESVKGKGNNEKQKAKALKFATVFDKKGGKATKAEIISVEENPAHEHFKRANIITKGAIIKVKIGSEEKAAIVTSRPGQSGTVSAVVVEGYTPEKAKSRGKKKEKKAKKEKTEQQPKEVENKEKPEEKEIKEKKD